MLLGNGNNYWSSAKPLRTVASPKSAVIRLQRKQLLQLKIRLQGNGNNHNWGNVTVDQSHATGQWKQLLVFCKAIENSGFTKVSSHQATMQTTATAALLDQSQATGQWNQPDLMKGIIAQVRLQVNVSLQHNGNSNCSWRSGVKGQSQATGNGINSSWCLLL